MKIPILTYDSMRIHGSDYGVNDLTALASDLRQLTEAGFRILPLRSVVDAWLDDRCGELSGKVVALACDHGADFDFQDLPHPTAGVQRSVLNILRDFTAANPGAQDGINITSFVVASPEARAVLDTTCMIGAGWWTDGWWPAALSSGLMHIGNGSWDHHHETLPDSFPRGSARGNFRTVDSRFLADYEIRQAAEYLRGHASNPGTALFAYPYGESNRYLVHEYFPCNGHELGIKAAFTARAAFLEPGSGKWEVPRFICGRDWRSPIELRAILDSAIRADHAWVPVCRVPSATASGVAVAPPIATELPEGKAGNEWSADSISDEGFRARFVMVPQVLSEWIKPYRKLEGLDILDFGCGEGISALGLALNYGARRVVGVDIGPDPERCLPSARAQLGLSRLPESMSLFRVIPGFLHSDEERFDVAYSWSVFEHVDQRLVAPLLRLVRSSLKPGGLFLVQIAPLFFSAEGSHLNHKLDEPWLHLLTQHDVLHERLAAVVSDSTELQTLWGMYETLNRVTADELIEHLKDGGFEILRTDIAKDPRPVPPRLTAIFREEVLRTDQILVLCRPR